jgi:magnesium chelatase family protein
MAPPIATMSGSAESACRSAAFISWDPPSRPRPDEARDAATVASVSHGGFKASHWGVRPFRAPHHTASGVALVGGGSSPKPGEISLAHTGVLFLDELSEYSRQVLDVLREPMESGRVTISRALKQAEFPARFQLIAAMNPCPCGNRTDPKAICRCSANQIQRYQSRLSGPFLDRIDMQIEVPRVEREALQTIDPNVETSAVVRKRVTVARERQYARCGKMNAALGVKDIDAHCKLAENDAVLLDRAMQRLNLSARAYHRILKVARTIADLLVIEDINTACLSEAISYRSVDRSM